MISSIERPGTAEIGQMIPATQRRAKARTHSVSRVAQVVSSMDRGMARVRKITDHGLDLELYMPVHLGERLSVQLADDLAIDGTVYRKNGLDCGFRFHRELDSTALLGEMEAKPDSGHCRAARIGLRKAAVDRSQEQPTAIDSPEGTKVRRGGSFREGLPVRVSFTSGVERRGLVRWSRDNMAGVMLLQPYSA
jgi:hypothetical protein